MDVTSTDLDWRLNGHIFPFKYWIRVRYSDPNCNLNKKVEHDK